LNPFQLSFRRKIPSAERELSEGERKEKQKKNNRTPDQAGGKRLIRKGEKADGRGTVEK